MVTGISEAKLVGLDQIDVKLIDGHSITKALPMLLRDFLDFGHFLVAIRMAMTDGRLPNCRIDRGRVAESWGAAAVMCSNASCAIIIRTTRFEAGRLGRKVRSRRAPRRTAHGLLVDVRKASWRALSVPRPLILFAVCFGIMNRARGARPMRGPLPGVEVCHDEPFDSHCRGQLDVCVRR